MNLTPEVADLNQREAVHTVLKVMRRTLGLRIALVAQIFEGVWTACAVLDEAGFGLKPGDQLELSNTY